MGQGCMCVWGTKEGEFALGEGGIHRTLLQVVSQLLKQQEDELWSGNAD